MWGALTFLFLFLVIDPTTRDLILTALDEARLRVAVEAPLSYFVVVILLGSATVSALIMALWPKSRRDPVQYVHKRYQGATDSELRRAQEASGSWLHVALEACRHLLPARMALALEVRLRDIATLAALKRILRA
jgi:hypothetical protein